MVGCLSGALVGREVKVWLFVCCLVGKGVGFGKTRGVIWLVGQLYVVVVALLKCLCVCVDCWFHGSCVEVLNGGSVGMLFVCLFACLCVSACFFASLLVCLISLYVVCVVSLFLLQVLFRMGFHVILDLSFYVCLLLTFLFLQLFDFV